MESTNGQGVGIIKIEYTYNTITKPVRSKIAVGSCRFFASLAPCAAEKEARVFVEKVKKELYDATHHATAYRLGLGEEVLVRCDDDGEPAGTAGEPMLSVLEKFQLTNIVLIGTRFFGGVKLGLGGLARAYRSCAEAGVNAASICSRELQQQGFISTPYDYLGAVIKEVETVEGEILHFHYNHKVGMNILIPARKMERLQERLANVTKGKAKIKILKSEKL